MQPPAPSELWQEHGQTNAYSIVINCRCIAIHLKGLTKQSGSTLHTKRRLSVKPADQQHSV